MPEITVSPAGNRSFIEVTESAAGPDFVSIWRQEIPKEGAPERVCLAVITRGELRQLLKQAAKL